MAIQIHDKKKISAIQKEFNAQFQGLKLEFFSKPHKPGGAPVRKIVKRADKTLAECRTLHNSGKLELSGNMTINEIEDYFASVYGLGIKILAKSGRSWKNAVRKKGVTIADQNAKAIEMNY